MSVVKVKPDKQGRCYHFKCYYHNEFNKLEQYYSKAFSLKKEAEQAERIFLMNSGSGLDTSCVRMIDLFNSYYEFKKDKVRITSLIDYKKYMNAFSPIYNIKIDDFNIEIFNSWKKHMNNREFVKCVVDGKEKKQKYSTVYKNKIYYYLIANLRYGIKYHNYNLSQVLNQMTKFSNPNEFKKEMNFYTYDEFKQFINCENDLTYKCFWEMLYYCGLRKGEAEALNWNDIDLNNSLVTINKGLSQKIKGSSYVIIPPKNKSSNRVLKMPKILVNDLTELKNSCIKYNNYHKNWFVFGGVFPLSNTQIQVRQASNEKLANVQHIRIHDFRHSCASLLINSGASILLVSKYLGHSNISTTLNTYSHLYKNQFDEIVNTIDNLDEK